MAQMQSTHADESGAANAAVTTSFVRNGLKTQQSDFTEAMARIRLQLEAVKAGDLSGLEEMLVGQEIGIQAIYSQMVSLGMSCQDPETIERFLQLGLKAQTECRTSKGSSGAVSKILQWRRAASLIASLAGTPGMIIGFGSLKFRCC